LPNNSGFFYLDRIGIDEEYVEISEKNLDVMIRNVVREHHWSPETIENLYLDDADFFALGYWNDDVQKVIEGLKKKK